MTPQTIYFDESGFTGNNLLNRDQPLFSYGSVACRHEEAVEFLTYLRTKYHLQGPELKGSRLIRGRVGRQAVEEVLHAFDGRIRVSVSDKKYALACKFFEYIFEPCISEGNSLFYAIGFHKFVATYIYVEFCAREESVDQLFQLFEAAMRAPADESISAMLDIGETSTCSDTMKLILEFAQYHIADIRTEILALPGDGAGKWILDITNSALFSLLAHWGTIHDEILAVCDRSGPVKDNAGLFRGMIGRRERIFTSLFGEPQPITFHLAGPIQFADSAESPGIQIADIIAAATIYAVLGVDDDLSNTWRKMLPEIAPHGSLFPDLGAIDLDTKAARVNAIVLMELNARARARSSLTDGMAEYIDLLGHVQDWK